MMYAFKDPGAVEQCHIQYFDLDTSKFRGRAADRLGAERSTTLHELCSPQSDRPSRNSLAQNPVGDAHVGTAAKRC